jgi:hypothetical protein
LGNVASMTTCAVLRCQTPGSIVITGGQYLNDVHEAYICAVHNEKIGAGALWDIQDGAVLLDQDMPARAETWSIRDGVGTEGFTLTLQIAGQLKPFEVFLTPADVTTLSTLLSSRGE